ncbi:questin oxidase family protein [Sphaerisporangium perillae]|uniref:questin oxidase family protein n=1 Tax=Sphaerisporangium perillae TaxID=2935860 RepID=UPI00200F00F1|nr:questin oxidase family protein [Sphaerisporangium perillae]
MDRDVLNEAYDRLHRMGPEFGGDEEGNHGLTNHGPMVAEVLVRRGHEDDVPCWVDEYVPRLRELPTGGEPIGDENWREAIGDGRRIADWTLFFSRSLAERPWQEVLAAWWPRLLPGIAAGSTHGVIRVGHAVRALLAGETEVSRNELAHGLAFWAGRWRTLPGLTEPAGEQDAAQALAAIPHLPEQKGLIAFRVPRLAGVPGWTPALAALRPPADDDDVPARLKDLIDAATVRYLAYGKGSPVLLVHTATAPNAVLHTLPALPRPLWAPSLSAVWAASAAIVAMYEPAEAVPRELLPKAPDTSDPAAETLHRAVEHGDEHVIKLADTAVDSFARTGDPDTLAAAALAAELLDARS